MWRTPATLDGRLDDVPNAGLVGRSSRSRRAATTPAPRSSRPDGEIRSNVISSQGVHDRYGGVVPEVASRHHLELVNAVVDDALARAGATLDDVELVAVTQGPGPGRRAARRRADRQGARRGPAAAAGGRRPPPGPRRRELPRAATRCEPPFLCLIASGGHTLLAVERDRDGYEGARARRSTTRRARPSTRARAAARAPFPAAPRSSAWRARATRPAFDFPIAARVAGLDFSFAGLKTALLYKVRDLGEEAAAARRADLAASYQHAIVEALARRVERGLRATGLHRLALGGGVAANGPLRERIGRLGVEFDVPARELCTDNAAMIASAARYAEAIPFPGYLALDAYARSAA